MQKSHDYQISMHTDVLGVCNTNQVLLDQFDAYEPAKTTFDLNIVTEKELAARLERLSKNSAVPKNLSRSAVTVVALDLSNNLSSFAWVKGDMKLYLEVKYTKTSLKAVSDSEFIRICENLFTVAQDNLTQLADRNITALTLTDDRAQLQSFVTEKQLYIDTRREHYDVNEQLNQQIKTTNFGLKSIDGIIDSLSNSQPLVAADYWKARNLPKPVGSKVVMKGKVFDGETNQPLPGSIVTITQFLNNKAGSGSELQKIVKVKSAGGGFQLKSLPNGVYTVTVSYFGYADQQVTAYVNNGVLTIVPLPLNKLPEIIAA